MTEPHQHYLDEHFEALEKLFREGQFSTLWSQLQGLNEHELPEKRQRRYYFFILTCAVYEIGDIDQAMALNRTLDFGFHPTIRYRLCLRQKDYVTARRIRHAYDYNENVQADFRYTLGLHCLAKSKFKFGFHFYQERYHAINTPKSLIEPLQYHYLTQNPAEDPNNIILEQGMGEVLISLLHIKDAGHHKTSNFCGMPKYRRMVARYFPQAKYHSRLKLSEFEGQHGILALDFLQRAWLKQRSFLAKTLLDTPLRTRHSGPKFGICWRGGSAQNRREERHIPLSFFVEFLPKEYDYIVLQYDVTEEETEFLKRHPNIQTPLVDLTNDALVTFDLIRELAGVIAVAGANWHLAGSANIPFLAIMHDSAHWLWGKTKSAQSVYPSATTISKDELSYKSVSSWAKAAYSQWQIRPIAGAPASEQLSERPIFVTGLPGTMLSQTMQVFAEQGIWLGKDATHSHFHNDPIEAYGNPLIRHRLLFNILNRLGASEDGLALPPCAERLPPFPWLRFQIERALADQNYDGETIWALKDFRLTLLWPLLARAYPNAIWVIVEQDTNQVAAELVDNPHYKQHSHGVEYWKMYLNVFNDRLQGLRQSQENVVSLPKSNKDDITRQIQSLVAKINKGCDAP